MISRSLIALLVLGAPLAVAPAQAQTKKVTIATEGAYEPWNFTRPDGTLAGFEIDLAADLCLKAKIECEIVAQDWDGMIPALNAGKFDAVMAGMSKTAERMKVIDFSQPYAVPPNGFGVLKDSSLVQLPHPGEVVNISKDEAKATAVIDSMKELLKGKTIGVQTASTNSAFAEKYLKDVVEIREYKTTEQHDLDLVAGRIDAVFETVIAMNSSRSKPGMEDLVQAGPAFVGGMLGEGVAVAVRKTDTDLKALFDAAIQTAIADGTVKKLSEKWFKVDVSPKN